jgi:hypothetical protein
MASSAGSSVTREEKMKDERCSDEEAQRRFEVLVKAALNTPPKPMKDVPRKRAVSSRGGVKPTPSRAVASSDGGDGPPQT